MPFFTVKPVIVEAIQFNDNVEEIEKFVGKELNGNMNGTGKVQELYIPVHQCEVPAKENDWILKQRDGSFMVVSPDIFELYYIETFNVSKEQLPPQYNRIFHIKNNKMEREIAIQRIAIQALQGLLANPENHRADWNKIAELAVTYAKSLYAQFEAEFPENIITIV